MEKQDNQFGLVEYNYQGSKTYVDQDPILLTVLLKADFSLDNDVFCKDLRLGVSWIQAPRPMLFSTCFKIYNTAVTTKEL